METFKILKIGINKDVLLHLENTFPVALIHVIDDDIKLVCQHYGFRIFTYLCDPCDTVRVDEICENIKFDIIINDSMKYNHYLKPNRIYI